MNRILLATLIMFLKLHLAWAESAANESVVSDITEVQMNAGFDYFVN